MWFKFYSLHYILEYKNKEYWVDGSNWDDVNVWKFSDGSAMPLTAEMLALWQGTPASNTRKCVRLKDPHWMLNDRSCSSNYRFICEKV